MASVSVFRKRLELTEVSVFGVSECGDVFKVLAGKYVAVGGS